MLKNRATIGRPWVALMVGPGTEPLYAYISVWKPGMISLVIFVIQIL